MPNSVHRRAAGLVGLVGTLALAVAACGDDATNAETVSTAPSTVSVSESAPTTVAEPSAAPSGSESTSSDEPAPTSSTGGVTVTGERGVDVTLTGPIAAKYTSATPAQKKRLGSVLTGDHNGEKRPSGVVFQQFAGGVIVAKNDNAGTRAHIVWGPVRDAWNIERAPSGVPSQTGSNGSAGPLGVPTSDVRTVGDREEASFEHGSIVYHTRTDKVVVTVDGEVVPAGL